MVLVAALLAKSPLERLTSLESVKAQAFFAAVDWGALVRKELSAPWVPEAEAPAARRPAKRRGKTRRKNRRSSSSNLVI